MKYIKWILRNVEEIISGTAMIIVIVSVCIGVFSRYILRTPTAWSNELAGITFTWAVFMGASAAFKRNMHIGIDILVLKSPPKLKIVLVILSNLIILAFCVFMVVKGIDFTLYSFKQPTSVLRIPNTYYLMSVPLAFLLMTAHQIRLFIVNSKKWIVKE